MEHAYWNDWYFGWGWFLWLGFILLLFSGIGNWGYTYRAHRRLGSETRSEGRTISEVATELNMLSGTLKSWMREAVRQHKTPLPSAKRADLTITGAGRD